MKPPGAGACQQLRCFPAKPGSCERSAHGSRPWSCPEPPAEFSMCEGAPCPLPLQPLWWARGQVKPQPVLCSPIGTPQRERPLSPLLCGGEGRSRTGLMAAQPQCFLCPWTESASDSLGTRPRRHQEGFHPEEQWASMLLKPRPQQAHANVSYFLHIQCKFKLVPCSLTRNLC